MTRGRHKVDTTQSAPAQTLAASDKLYMETTLLRVAGALFCHDAKRAASRNSEIELNRGSIEKHIVIRPDPRLGQPGPLAHKLFIALMKKHSDYGRPVRNQVSFSRKELARLIGRADFGGEASEQISRALHEIHYAFVIAHFKVDDRYVEDSFNIFSRLIVERHEFASGSIEGCTITIADPIITSLKDHHFSCLNHALMTKLGTIGQALYLRIFFHFANSYESQSTRHGLSLEKHYGDLCTEWLGGLAARTHKSLVLQQLGPHLDQLQAAGFLASFGVTAAKSRAGFIVTFRPGPMFFEDYNRFYRQRNQGELQWDFHGDRRDQQEPYQVAALFMNKFHGVPTEKVATVMSHDVTTARELISLVGYDQVPAFLDYALAEAKKTRFEVARLIGLKPYVDRFRAHVEHQPAAAALSKVQRAEALKTAERKAYEDWCDQAIRQRLAALAPEVVHRIEAEIRAKQPRQVMPAIVSIQIQVALQRHAKEVQPIPDFETWKARV